MTSTHVVSSPDILNESTVSPLDIMNCHDVDSRVESGLPTQFHVFFCLCRISKALLTLRRSNHPTYSFDFEQSNDCSFTLVCSEEVLRAFVIHLKAFIERQKKLQEARPIEVSTKHSNQPLQAQPESLIVYEAEPRVWAPTFNNGLVRIPSRTAVKRIASITGCTIEPDEASSGFRVKGTYDSDIHNALRKLQAIHEAESVLTPLVYDFLCDEGEIDFSILVRPLQESQSRRFKPKLIVASDRLKIPNPAYVIILKDHKGNVIRVKEATRTLPSSSLWESHSLPIVGKQLVSSSPPDASSSYDSPSPGPGLTNNPVKVWLKETSSPLDGLLDAFTTVPVPYQDDENASLRQPKKRIRKARGTEASSALGAGESSTVQSHSTKNATRNPSNNASSTSADELSQADSTLFRSLSNNDTYSWKKTTSPAGNSADLLSLDTSSTQLQSADNKKTQDRVHHTMRQRAPVSVTGKSAILKEYEKRICDLLAKSRSRSGPLKLEVEFGQLLVEARGGPLALQKKEWNAAFSPKGPHKLSSVFVDKLTTNALEAGSITALKLRGGRPLFSQIPQQRLVTYELECKCEDQEEIIIIIREDGSHYVRPKELLMGALNLHYPKRAWDARVAVTASKITGSNYTSSAEAIAKSFAARPLTLVSDLAQQPTFAIAVESPNSMVKIEKMTLRRETVHPSTVYPDLLLHLVEKQDTRCASTAGVAASFVGFLSSKREMVSAGRLWWTASVSSVSSQSILQENKDLALGQTATWSAGKVVRRETISDMAALAEDVITRIDYIGFASGASGSLG